MTHQETANLKETVNLLNQQFDHLRRQGRQGRQFMQFVIKHLQQQIEMRRNTLLPPSRVEEKKPSLLLRSQLNQALSGLHARLSILTLEGILSSTTNLMLAIQPYMQNTNPTQRHQLQTQLESAGYPDHAIKRVFNKPTYASFAVEKLQREERVPSCDLLIHNPKDIANKKPTSYHEK